MKLLPNMIHRNLSLKKYNTFGLDHKADCLISIQSEAEAISILRNLSSLKGPLFVLSGGSNILFTRDFEGTLIHPEITGIDIVEEKDDHIIISAGAGLIWDDLVDWTVSRGYGGLENLSLIPGMVGSTPVQNIGAYGVEIKDYIEKVRVISFADASVREFSNKECEFGYRDSVFKHRLKGEFLVTNVWFRLTKEPVFNLLYGSLQEEVEKIGSETLKNVRQAVINIRTFKLPDPDQIGNAGSFFKNPVVHIQIAEELRKKFSQIPVYDDPSGGKKLAAGWLIDQCGWKGKRRGDAGVHDKQALVLVNYGNATGMQILNLSEEIRLSVSERFGIGLEREVEVV
jgi:UDP-N-acetylmuramate dehydrogenase